MLMRKKQLIAGSLAVLLAASAWLGGPWPASGDPAGTVEASGAGDVVEALGAGDVVAASGADRSGKPAGTENPARPAVVAEKAAEATEGRGFYYGQLSDKEKSYYEAMEKMLEQGVFKTGSQCFDLADNGYVSQEELKAYLSGDTNLFYEVGAARDAFYAEHPGIFYVDFNKFSMRVTADAQGRYHANLGSGREGSYYAVGFSSEQDVDAAIEKFEKRLEELVAGAKEQEAKGEMTLRAAQVKYVHDELINHASYRLENTCKPENVGYVRTAYGVLVAGEGVCESYSRAFQAVMDRLGIPCISVSGIYRHSEKVSELHMWNYVQLENGGWYAVDATMDDPYREDLTSNEGVDGFENTDYLLAGDEIMGRNHATSGILSSSNREFIYPQLALESINVNRVSSTKDLVVDVRQSTFEGETSGEYHVSYKGMGYKKAAETGIYMIAKMYIYYENTGETIFNDWAYLTPELYPAMQDSDTEIILPSPHCQFIEFAVTDVAPGDYLSDPSRLYYQGDPLLVEEDTGMLHNPYASYVAPPYVKSITPSASGRIFIGSTYHVKAVYDDVLQLADGATKAGYRVEVPTAGSTGAKYCKVENFSWDGASTVEFDFTPSEMWADDCIAYQIHLTGLVGARSGKVPNFIGYYASHRCAVCAYRSQGYDWNVFGKPSLLENSDLSTTGWKTSDGEPIADSLKNRMVLVATSTTNAQADAMGETLGSEFPNEEVLKSETYDISLSICKQQVIETGQGVRVSVGFPEGYGPDDEGVTFKAYHFIRNDAGEITGVEEIPCVVTRYGLLICCKSFSPFTIAAVKDDNKAPSSEKSIVLSSTPGGIVTSEKGNFFTLSQGQGQDITIQAEDGYEIEEVVAAGKVQKVTDKKTMTVRLNYQDIREDSAIVDAKFVASAVREQEEKRGETAAMPVAGIPAVKLLASQISAKEGDPVEIAADVDANGMLSFQWYKDGAALPGQTKQTLHLTAAAGKDAGSYRLAVRTMVDTTEAEALSEPCALTVLGKSQAAKPPEAPGRVSGLKAKSTSSRSVRLTWKKVAGADGYRILRYDATARKFKQIKDVTSRSFTNKKLKAGTPYRYKVCAYRTANGAKVTGPASKEAKIITKPKAPTRLKAVRVSKKSVKITFTPAQGQAAEYRILSYDSKAKKFTPAYRVKKARLYRYQAKTRKYRPAGKATVSRNGRVTVTLKGITGKKFKFRMQTAVSKSGYKTATSAVSENILIKLR